MRPYAVLPLLLLAGCGVRADDAPRPLADVVVTAAPGATPLARPAAATVYLVRAGSVVPVRRLLVAPATAERRLAALTRGPDDREAATGLGTALADQVDVQQVRVRDGVAVVELAASFEGADAVEQSLAVAQVVLTLTESPEVRAVRFTVNGAPVAVPRADGGRTRSAVTRADYAPAAG